MYSPSQVKRVDPPTDGDVQAERVQGVVRVDMATLQRAVDRYSIARPVIVHREASSKRKNAPASNDAAQVEDVASSSGGRASSRKRPRPVEESPAIDPTQIVGGGDESPEFPMTTPVGNRRGRQ